MRGERAREKRERDEEAPGLRPSLRVVLLACRVGGCNEFIAHECVLFTTSPCTSFRFVLSARTDEVRRFAFVYRTVTGYISG